MNPESLQPNTFDELMTRLSRFEPDFLDWEKETNEHHISYLMKEIWTDLGDANRAAHFHRAIDSKLLEIVHQIFTEYKNHPDPQKRWHKRISPNPVKEEVMAVRYIVYDEWITNYLKPRIRQSTTEDYQDWLNWYLELPGEKSLEFSRESFAKYSQSGKKLTGIGTVITATDDIAIPPFYGGFALEIIVPEGVAIDTIPGHDHGRCSSDDVGDEHWPWRSGHNTIYDRSLDNGSARPVKVFSDTYTVRNLTVL